MNAMRNRIASAPEGAERGAAAPAARQAAPEAVKARPELDMDKGTAMLRALMRGFEGHEGIRDGSLVDDAGVLM